MIVVGVIGITVVYSGLWAKLTSTEGSAFVSKEMAAADNEALGEDGADEVVQSVDMVAQITPVSKAGKSNSTISKNKDYSSFDKSAWNLLLVNKQHPIPEDYSYTLGSISGNMKCDERIIKPLNDMINAANEEGIYLKVCSPYRDLNRQEYLFKKKMKQYLNTGKSFIDAYREASSVVTVPGASEHEIGLSLDIVSTSHQTLDEKFGETDAGQWLMNNAYKFGFILRYPKGKEDITGIIYEPWHYRYVGREAAEIIYEEKITLEEFIEKL